jgi:hypothetical protein
MSFALEEYCEDAVVKFLNDEIDSGDINIYTAWTDAEIKYPCAVVHCGKSSNVEGTNFCGPREVDITIAVMTEAAASADKTARERNRSARDSVLTALAQDALHDDINALSPDGVAFSLAYVGEITRSVESDKRVFVSEIQLVCIASSEDLI